MIDATARNILILGIGNRYRSDDSVGPWVAARLHRCGLNAREFDGDGAALIVAWEGEEVVVLVDAMRSGAAPGTVRHFDAVDQPLPAGQFPSFSHQFGVAEAIETARVLGRLPRSLSVYGVEGVSFDFGESLSEPVALAAADVERLIVDRFCGDE